MSGRKYAANDPNRPAARLGMEPPPAMGHAILSGAVVVITVLGVAFIGHGLCRLRGRDIER